MDKKRCKNCRHFIQHYGLRGGQLYQVFCGHCVLQRPRSRKPDAKVCSSFEMGELDEAQFVTREYLTKELLRRVLEMELLPAIGEVSAEDTEK